MLKLITSLAVILVGSIPMHAQEDVQVRVDCREGVGLIPALWRGVSTDGNLPGGIQIKTAYISPDLVRRAWDGRLSGGSYQWGALDAALDSVRARGVETILPLPVPQGPALSALWPELVHDTASRTQDRVTHYEILEATDAGQAGGERYLDHYERGVWAVYRVKSGASVGGAGAPWASPAIERLVRRCSERRLPLGFVSWRADRVGVGQLRHSVDLVTGILGRYPLTERPLQIVSGWSVEPDTVVSASVQTVRAIVSVLDRDLATVCADLKAPSASPEALRALQRLGLVRVLTAIPDNPWGVDGIVSLDGEDVVALFWQAAHVDAVQAMVSFSGLPFGTRARVDRFVYAEGVPTGERMETHDLRLQEPLNVPVPVTPGGLTVVAVSVE